LTQTKGESVINLATPGILSSSALCLQHANSNLAELISPTRNIDRALKLGATQFILAFPSNDTTNGMSAEQTINNFLEMRQCAHFNDKARVAVMSSNKTPLLLKLTQPCEKNLAIVLSRSEAHLQIPAMKTPDATYRQVTAYTSMMQVTQ
jgi:hypothetical protein